MTIGTSYDYPAQRAEELIATQAVPQKATPWTGSFPSPPDLCFDYRKLISQSGGVAQATKPDHKICIIGAGITGLTAARELYRCGFNQIDVYEASNRIGGRHRTVTDVGWYTTDNPYSPFEMGAMRMPFFNHTGQPPADGSSLLAYYAKEFGIATENFPNPGTRWVSSTGIYLEDGLFSSATPTMQIWRNPTGAEPPPTVQLQAVYDKWRHFEKLMVDVVSSYYSTNNWETMWSAIVKKYQGIPFRDFVTMPALDRWSSSEPGNFGGLGLNAEESRIFYSIGFGDGSWGAFYDVCSIYPLRTAIFGFGSNLQLIPGRFNGSTFNPGPYATSAYVEDGLGTRFEAPRYRGVKAFDDCMLFLVVPERGRSFYNHSISRFAGIFTQAEVIGIEKMPSGKILVRFLWTGGVEMSAEYDSVIVTVPSWIMEMKMRIEGFNSAMLSQAVTYAYKTAHWETSVKVYAALDPTFFTDTDNKIPQILVTDSFVHDVYAYRYGVGGYTFPCILVSYTWEDDATKFAYIPSDQMIVDKCIAELDRICTRSSNIGQPISRYINNWEVSRGLAKVERWISDPMSLGCAKLYRASTYSDAMRLLTYNRDTSAASGLYFAGESFSVDAGWTEPCLRGAIDAVINLCNNTQATFNGGFTMNDYPRYHIE
ncbi:flavin monoamine oxidase family protein [Burkholderia pseudomallei]|uniref:flavin monoamine oxidase family protein n=1 Tax=Burkholderia pseudomallei TaxID=28450 RepID=UPI00190DB95B|nr:FAD-dependent oxidoreductase [Burkholderia pseudomallei]MBK3337197.1 FAD-dependent oxidoreductase [Burkholderia pseudomallei]